MIHRKILISVIIGIFIAIGGFFQIGFLESSTDNSFEEKTKKAGIDINYIKEQPTISRYEVTRLLNAVECVDCINPGNNLIDNYTNNFWTNFQSLPGKDFDDIFYREAIYNNKSYYYCVATVAEKEYMFGYPIITSPLCPGEFCGQNNMSKGEFIQVINNILGKYINKNYITNRSQIKEWYEQQKKGSYNYNVFNEKDKSIINTKALQCTSDQCQLTSNEEFHTYLKYCMFNLNKCNMKELGRIKQGYWPIAELNIIIKENIIDINNNFINTIHEPIDGKTAVDAFGKIFPKIQCDFNTDYDCDGILNQNDNCPNHYNPRQIDTDQDKIGDVCDDDIDGDGVKNPIGIVDERGSININMWNKNSDNCIYNVNTNQIDSNSNYQGDSCDLSTIKGISIESRVIGTGENKKIYAYVVTDYTPIEKDREWIINGEKLYGKEIYYPITKSGGYTLYVQSIKDKRRKATSNIIVQYNKEYTYSDLDISLSKDYLPLVVTANVKTNTLPYQVIRKIDGNEQQNKTTSLQSESSFLIRKEGTYTLTSIIKNSKDDILSISSRDFVLKNENNIVKKISINNLNPIIGEKVIMTTNEKIKSWFIDWGDNNKDTVGSNTISHTYTKEGVYLLQSTITLSDDTIIHDKKTIIIKNKNIESSKFLYTKPNQLENNTNLSIPMNIKRIGYTNNDIIKNIFYDGIFFSTGVINNIGNYSKAGIYYPEIKEIVGMCKIVSNQSTIIINDDRFSCLSMKINNTKAQCDLDKDGIDDRCDDDIDGDGVKNPIGLIIENDKSCDINKAVIDKDKLNDMLNQLQGKKFNNICKSLDNCPLQSNENQEDGNVNGIGNQCEGFNYNTTQSNGNGIGGNQNNEIKQNDSDQDGIPDQNDQCPTLQETYNGYQDIDGCPELGDNNPCNTQVLGDSFIGFECLQCPCQYVQEDSDLNPGDIIRATLRNVSGTILQSRSDIKSL